MELDWSFLQGNRIKYVANTDLDLGGRGGDAGDLLYRYHASALLRTENEQRRRRLSIDTIPAPAERRTKINRQVVRYVPGTPYVYCTREQPVQDSRHDSMHVFGRHTTTLKKIPITKTRKRYSFGNRPQSMQIHFSDTILQLSLLTCPS
jgi:hypothetical protein